MSRKIFLTGGTGFIGLALLKRFVGDGQIIRALVRCHSDRLPDDVEQVLGELPSLAGDDKWLSQTNSKKVGVIEKEISGCEVVVHAAARAHIMFDESVDALTEYRKVNRDASLALARLAANSGAKRFVFISSIGVHGNQSTSPFTEVDGEHPHDSYSLSKYEAEQGLLEIARETSMEVVIIRPPLVYGCDAPGNFGSLVRWVKRGVPLPLGSVNNKRSLVALENLVDFIALCSDQSRSPKAANEVFLISDGEDVSIPELLRKVSRAYGKPSRLLPVPVGFMKFSAKILGKGSVADRLFGDLQVKASKARNLLGWKPVVTMDEQLAEMALYDKKMRKK